MATGKRIYLKRLMPEMDLLEEFRKLPASNIGDVMERSCGMNPRIRLMSSPKENMVGVALTVKSCAGDNLLLHAALDMAGENDVIVVSNEAGSNRSLIGEVMLSHLRYGRKAAGIVLDGPIRDIGTLQEWDFPIYAAGTTPGGPYKDGPGEINTPICCGNVSVYPGDILVGDPDGVIVIPRRDAREILAKAQAFHEADEAKTVAAREGRANRAWVGKAIAEKNYEIIDDIYRV